MKYIWTKILIRPSVNLLAITLVSPAEWLNQSGVGADSHGPTAPCIRLWCALAPPGDYTRTIRAWRGVDAALYQIALSTCSCFRPRFKRRMTRWRLRLWTCRGQSVTWRLSCYMSVRYAQDLRSRRRFWHNMFTTWNSLSSRLKNRLRYEMVF